MIIIGGPQIRTKVMSCKFMENMKCNFRNSADCKYHQNGNPEECILYKLIEDNEKLQEKVQWLEFKVNEMDLS